MDELEHRRRHRELHAMLDELLADWFMHGGGTEKDEQGRFATDRPILQLMEWSYRQTLESGPDHPGTKPS